MSISSVGLIQGRLTPADGRGIQFFPSGPGEWQHEFEVAKEIGIPSIQWVCDLINPLFDEAFRNEVREVIERTGVIIRNMDVQFLTTMDIADCPEDLMKKICSSLADIQGGTVEVPLLAASTLLEKEKYSVRVAALKRFVSVAKESKTPVAVETDLPPNELAVLLQEVPEVSVVYDTGNSAGLGYEVQEEIAAYGNHISNVHIKDKPKDGVTVPLGKGDADFVTLFKLLRDMSYSGAITLQAARGEDGAEAETIKHYQAFVKEQYEKSF
jgi:L-ribulose-5-phosphate 3-epimerase